MIYLEYDFKVNPPEPFTDVLTAELGALGFESFLMQDSGVLAYIRKSDWREGLLEGLFVQQMPGVEIDFSWKEIQPQNWNAEWERNFHPIRLGEHCVVRAPFHQSPQVQDDIVIEHKTRFGTGQYETTHMMLQHILETEFKGKSVLDMGCGTGVLAILAKKKAAAAVQAIDVDQWCYLNALEN